MTNKELDKYEKSSFLLKSLWPYQVELKQNKQRKIEFRYLNLAETQLGVSVAFFEGSLPHSITLEKLTCKNFQIAESDKKEISYHCMKGSQ